MSYATGTIAGSYQLPDGTPQQGFATIIPNAEQVKDTTGNVILTGRLNRIPLVDGAFSVEVPASDDLTLDPSGVTYTVALRFNTSHPPAVPGVFVPGGQTVQMADVTPVDPAAPVYAVQVTREDIDALTAHTGNTANPHAVTKAQVGLGNVDNASLRAQLARNPDLIIVGAVTRDANGAATSAPVVWPDGTAGTYTATTLSTAFPGAVDAYTVTYGAPVTRTYTQPAVTRDTNGAAVAVPAIGVS